MEPVGSVFKIYKPIEGILWVTGGQKNYARMM
jgi:hypothetical protein